MTQNPEGPYKWIHPGGGVISFGVCFMDVLHQWRVPNKPEKVQGSDTRPNGVIRAGNDVQLKNKCWLQKKINYGYKNSFRRNTNHSG